MQGEGVLVLHNNSLWISEFSMDFILSKHLLIINETCIFAERLLLSYPDVFFLIK